MLYPDIDPVALQLGPVAIHWYGIMYLVGFAGAWWLGRYRARQVWRGWNEAQVDDLIFYAALGVVLGGRLGYVLFYDAASFVEHPLRLLQIWKGGMAFHGGLIGVLVAMAWFARRHGKTFFETTDFVAPLVPIGLGAGRIGNFINAELWGKVSDAPWAMVFPGAGPLARHPSQLYQALLEGVLLFTALWWASSKPRGRCFVSGLFLLLYGIFRCVVEFVRVPDAHIQYLAWDWLTMGQILSVPMLVAGVVLLLIARGQTAGVTSTS
ncbi:MAG: phosphatidylglycerol:prolipoprotein diacylglycerol transferase [Gammaproteobacteria bacterium]|jgi:phosphatidylglycerol:prolipoprotein diacylglycerol transferase